MSKAQDSSTVDDEEQSIEDDLKILSEMDIDKDFNVWSEFRNSFSEAKREDMRQLSASAKVDIKSSISTMGSISECAISESDVCEDDNDESGTANSASLKRNDTESTCGRRSSLFVKFSPLSADERCDIREWAVRLERTQVFSRYYFPESWELREKHAIQKELLLTEPLACSGNKANQPNEVTQTTINSIFFPGDHDPKSVLLKRGPTLFDGLEERELLLFTHAFVLSRIEFDNLVTLLFDMNSVKMGSKEDTEKELQKRFDAIDSDCTGELDRCELRDVFKSMGVPIGEQMLTELMDRFDLDNSGTIDFREFKQVLNELAPKDEPKQCNSLFGNLRKTLMGGLSKSDIKRKLDFAFPLSDIERVESLHLCHSAKTEIFANSSWGEIAFAVFIRFRKNPLILVCSKPQHREAWVDAFRVCLINSRKLGGNAFHKEGMDIPGWQHKFIRDSLFSLVICDDHDGVERFIEDPPLEVSVKDHDEYNGCTALHYAVIWDRFHCAALLLANGAKVNAKDNDQKTPMDHAINKNMVNLLKSYGGECNLNLQGMVYYAEQEKLKSSDKTQKTANSTMQQAKNAVGAMSQAMSAMKERGERLEKLDNTTASLHNEATNYADMAKQLKETTRKKSLFGFRN